MTLQMTAPNDQEVLNARLFQPGSQKPARPQLDGTFLKLSFSYIPLKVILPLQTTEPWVTKLCPCGTSLPTRLLHFSFLALLCPLYLL